MTKEEFRFALMKTLPVFFSYVFLGTAFGISMIQTGASGFYAILTSVFVYTGAFQFALAQFIVINAPISTVLFTCLAMGSRHIFYGLSFIQNFKSSGKKYPYLVFALTDETYSLLCSLDLPEGLNLHNVEFLISLFNQSYWCLGTLIGVLAGTLIPLDFSGIDFSMTALFISIMVDQWIGYEDHVPTLAGLLSAIACLLVIRNANFILFALIIATYVLYLRGGNQACQPN